MGMPSAARRFRRSDGPEAADHAPFSCAQLTIDAAPVPSAAVVKRNPKQRRTASCAFFGRANSIIDVAGLTQRQSSLTASESTGANHCFGFRVSSESIAGLTHLVAEATAAVTGTAAKTPGPLSNTSAPRPRSLRLGLGRRRNPPLSYPPPIRHYQGTP